MRSEDPTERLRALCARVGFDLQDACASLTDRMRLLDARTDTIADAERMVALAYQVFGWYAAAKSATAFSTDEQRIVVLASLFSDIGKSGPLNADEAGRSLIADMFAVENVRDDTMPVARFFAVHFPDDAEARAARFTALGLDSSMTIRSFWNLHGSWTLDIAEAANLPVEAVAAAATHHLLENVNPRSIVGQDGRFTRAFGENVAFDRVEKLVIVLDKYDAVRRRGGRAHGEAIRWLHELVAKNPRFCQDDELRAIIDDVDAALRHEGTP